MSLLIHIELLHLMTQKKIQNFRITDNTFVDVDVEKLNYILRTSGHTQISEDDDNEKINVKDCDVDDDDDDDEIKKEEDNSD